MSSLLGYNPRVLQRWLVASGNALGPEKIAEEMVSEFEIEQVIPFARSACDWACKEEQDNRPQNCNVTSDILAIGLHWLGITNLERMKSYMPTLDPDDPEACHVWLRWNGTITIDPTASQFSDHFTEREVVVGNSEWHNRLHEMQPPLIIDAQRVIQFPMKYQILARRCFSELLKGYGIELKMLWLPDGTRIWKPSDNRGGEVRHA